jgi:hypothetical protein
MQVRLSKQMTVFSIPLDFLSTCSSGNKSRLIGCRSSLLQKNYLQDSHVVVFSFNNLDATSRIFQSITIQLRFLLVQLLLVLFMHLFGSKQRSGRAIKISTPGGSSLKTIERPLNLTLRSADKLKVPPLVQR